MNKTFFNTEENKNCSSEIDVLSAFRQHPEKPNQIQKGMSPVEIADIVSDHLMLVIKQQFEVAKREYLSSTNL